MNCGEIRGEACFCRRGSRGPQRLAVLDDATEGIDGPLAAIHADNHPCGRRGGALFWKGIGYGRCLAHCGRRRAPAAGGRDRGCRRRCPSLARTPAMYFCGRTLPRCPGGNLVVLIFNEFRRASPCASRARAEVSPTREGVLWNAQGKRLPFCAGLVAFKLQVKNPDRNNRLRIEKENVPTQHVNTPPSCECVFCHTSKFHTKHAVSEGLESGDGGRYIFHNGIRPTSRRTPEAKKFGI